jgi:hypothetical protein
MARCDPRRSIRRAGRFEKVMLANAGGSVAIAYRDARIAAPLADIQGAIELLRSAPDRRQILRSINRSARQVFNIVVRGQASQQAAIKRTAPHGR